MPLWQLKDKRAAVDRKETIQSSHLGSAACTAPERGSIEKRRCYIGSAGEVDGALVCVAWAGWGAVGRQGAGVCSVPAPCCLLIIQHTASVETAFHRWLKFCSRHPATHQHAPTAFKSCKMSALSAATRLSCCLFSHPKQPSRVSGQTEGCLHIPVTSGDWAL